MWPCPSKRASFLIAGDFTAKASGLRGNFKLFPGEKIEVAASLLHVFGQFYRSLTTRTGILLCRPSIAKKNDGKEHGERKIWSGRRVSNSRPQPWQGCALPTELLPQREFCGGARRSRTAVNGFAIRCMAALLSRRPFAPTHLPKMYGAGDESRTRDLNLGKVALYQLSYSRSENPHFTQSIVLVKS